VDAESSPAPLSNMKTLYELVKKADRILNY
jgi:hypothetical protein